MRRIRPGLEGELGVPFPGIVMRQVGGLQAGARILVNGTRRSPVCRNAWPLAEAKERSGCCCRWCRRGAPVAEAQKATGPERPIRAKEPAARLARSRQKLRRYSGSAAAASAARRGLSRSRARADTQRCPCTRLTRGTQAARAVKISVVTCARSRMGRSIRSFAKNTVLGDPGAMRYLPVALHLVSISKPGRLALGGSAASDGRGTKCAEPSIDLGWHGVGDARNPHEQQIAEQIPRMRYPAFVGEGSRVWCC